MRTVHSTTVRAVASVALAFLATAPALSGQSPALARRSPAARATMVATFPSADIDALVALAARIDARWDARDADGVAALYASDATLRLAGDAPLRGRAAIRSRFVTSLAQLAPDLRHRTEVESLHPLSANVVMTEGRAYVERAHADGSREVVRAYDVTSVLVRGGGGWRIASVRARPVPTDAAADSSGA